MERNDLHCGWSHASAVQKNTYVNHELNQQSCIDHLCLEHF